MKFLPWLFPCRTCTTLVTLMSSKVSQMCFWRIWSPYPHSDHCEQTWYCLMWPLETISKITALWKPALLRASTCWGVIMNNTAFQNSIPPFALIHSLKLLLGSPFRSWQQPHSSSAILFWSFSLSFAHRKFYSLSATAIWYPHLFLLRSFIYSAYQEGWEGSWSLCTDTCTVCQCEAFWPCKQSHRRPWHLEINHTEHNGCFLTILQTLLVFASSSLNTQQNLLQCECYHNYKTFKK